MNSSNHKLFGCIKNVMLKYAPPIFLFSGMFFLWLFGIQWFSLIPEKIFPGKNFELPENYNDLGNMYYSGMNALFSGLAFAGVIVAIFLQRKELIEQKKELQYTRLEFHTTRIQSVVYQQVEKIEDVINSTDFVDGEKKIGSGIIAFSTFVENFKLYDRKHESQEYDRVTALSGQIFYNDLILRELIRKLTSSVRLMNRLLNVNKELSQNQEIKNDLKSIFWENLSPVILDFLNTILSININLEITTNEIRMHQKKDRDEFIKTFRNILDLAARLKETDKLDILRLSEPGKQME